MQFCSITIPMWGIIPMLDSEDNRIIILKYKPFDSDPVGTNQTSLGDISVWISRHVNKCTLRQNFGDQISDARSKVYFMFLIIDNK